MGINRQGKRNKLRKDISEVKTHKKSVCEIFKSLDSISNALRLNNITINEDNILYEVSKVSDIELGDMEKLILLNTQKEYEENNIK